jgi:prepilin-type N-terminal cleavage/methylation domain-containing protein
MNELRSLRKATARKSRMAMSLVELMCVIAIISILAALYLPAVAKAFVRIKNFLSGLQ